ncbi:adhesin [Achromatium sp. WMS3]|nr:adhesin [Achromatium sp. WMS3]
MFNITLAAAQQINKASEQGGTVGMPLRLAAHQKPTGDIEYLMGFDEAKEDDIRLKSAGINIIMAPEHAILLDKTILDFVEIDGEESMQFIFINPKDPKYIPPEQ